MDVKAEQDQFATTMEDAVSSIKTELDDFTRFVTGKKQEIAEIFRTAGGRAGEQISGIATEIRASGDQGLAVMARSVSNNPLTALAIAAGVGVLIGLTWGRR